MRPSAIQAEVLTFQKWSLSSSASFCFCFLLGLVHILAMVQQAALLMLLSESLRHLVTESTAEEA
jgi:hypothetical protein